jgi:hypothetical protein
MGLQFLALESKNLNDLEGTKLVGSRHQPSSCSNVDLGGTPTVVDPAVQAVWDKKDIKA